MQKARQTLAFLEIGMTAIGMRWIDVEDVVQARKNFSRDSAYATIVPGQSDTVDPALALAQAALCPAPLNNCTRTP